MLKHRSNDALLIIFPTLFYACPGFSLVLSACLKHKCTDNRIFDKAMHHRTLIMIVDCISEVGYGTFEKLSGKLHRYLLSGEKMQACFYKAFSCACAGWLAVCRLDNLRNMTTNTNI